MKMMVDPNQGEERETQMIRLESKMATKGMRRRRQGKRRQNRLRLSMTSRHQVNPVVKGVTDGRREREKTEKRETGERRRHGLFSRIASSS